MRIENRMQMKSWKQKMVLLAGVLCLALMANAPAQAKPDVPFVVDAILKTKEAPTAEGRWVVTATVKFIAKDSPTMTATGPVNFAGIPADGFIKGVLPMKIGDDAGDVNTLDLTIRRDGTLSIQWLIAGKPFLGRQPMVFSPTAFSDHLSQGINFGGAKRLMVVKLTSELVKPPKIRVPGKKSPPIRVPGREEKKEPIGKRYKITGYAHVTNADDGYADHTVEVLGYVAIKYRTGDKWIDTEVIPLEKKRSLGKNDSIDFQEMFVDSLFSSPTDFIHVSGNFVDVDKASANDLMWTTKSEYREDSSFKLDKCVKKGVIVIPGDRDSENIEVYFTVTAVGDIF